MFQIKGKVALVTGGANGIGFCVVRELLRSGAEGVAIIDVNDVQGKSAVEKLSKEFRKECVIYINADVSKKSQLENAFEQTIKTFKHLQIIVNNAGIVQELQWERCVAANFLGCINGSLLAMDKYFPRYLGTEQGIILNISSIFGLEPLQEVPVYSGTKAGVLGFSRALSGPLRSNNLNVKVLTVCPGATMTSILDLSKAMTKELAASASKAIGSFPKQSPENAAAHIVAIIKEGETGSIWVVEANTRSIIKLTTKTLEEPRTSL